MSRRGDFIQTFTGRRFWPLDPRPEEIDVLDIAHALSLINRFNGHTSVPFSVAQHSVMVAAAVPAEDALWGLLHDAAEAYIGDVAKPLKHLPQYVGFREIETLIMGAVCERFGLSFIQPTSVHLADHAMLWHESQALMKPEPCWAKWEAHYPGVDDRESPIIRPWDHGRAKLSFLKMFDHLTNNGA